MSRETESEPEPSNVDLEKEDVAPKDKAVGILLLLVVAAGLWAFMKFVPGALDQMMGRLTSKIETSAEPDRAPGLTDEQVDSPKTPQVEPVAGPHIVVKASLTKS